MKNKKLQIQFALTIVLLFVSKSLYAAVEVPDEELGYFVHAGRDASNDHSYAATEETKIINDRQGLPTASSLESSSQPTLFPSFPPTSFMPSPTTVSSSSSQLLSSSSPPTPSRSLNSLFFKLRLSGLQKINFPKLTFLSQTIPTGGATVSRKFFKKPGFSHQRSNLEEQFPDRDRYTKHNAFSNDAPERFQASEESSKSAGTTRRQKDFEEIVKIRYDKRSYTCPLMFPSVFPVWYCLKYNQLIRKEMLQRRQKQNNRIRTHTEVSRKSMLHKPIYWNWRFPFQDYTAFHRKPRNDIYG